MRKIGLLFTLLLSSAWLEAQYFPSFFPNINIQRYSSQPLCDHLFLASVRFVVPSPKPPVAMILDRNGDLEWFYQGSENMFDFKPQAGAYISLFMEPSFYLLDSTMNLAGQVDCVGRSIDFHALEITANGRIFALCSVDSVMDLSSINTAGGLPGSVTGTVVSQSVQELTHNGQLVKEWLPWDWFDIQDSDTVFFTQPGTLDLTHTNSIDFYGSHMMLSHRSMHEVTVLDWNTGIVEYRLGGANNSFNMPGSAVFKGQHSAKWVTPTQVSLFDNGAQNDPPLARGLTLDINTNNWTASIANATPRPGIVSNSMGSFFVHADSSSITNLGRFAPNAGPNIQLHDASGTLMADITLEPTYFTYSAICGEMPFELRRPNILCQQISPDTLLFSVDEVAPSYSWSTEETGPSILVTDTGRYQVFVPRGIGFAGSPAVEIHSLAQGCPVVSNDPVVTGPIRPKKLVQRTDLLGRPVQGMPKQTVILEVYSDGSVRKYWVE